MKKYLIIVPILTALTLSPSFAEDKKEKKQKATPAELIATHDADGDGKLDESELSALLKAMPKKGKKK